MTEVEKIKDYREKGYSVAWIARRLKLAETTVRRTLRGETNVGRGKTSKLPDDETLTELLKTHTQREIARKYDVGPSAVASRLRRMREDG